MRTFIIGLLLWGASNMVAAEPAVRLIGYLPDYRATAFDAKAAAPLTDLLVFSAEPTANGQLDRSRLKNVPWEKLRTFKTQNGTRLLLCVGGWERSTHFATVVQDDGKRATFIKAAVQVCTDERLDGLDLDWEHPKNVAEQKGYAQLLAELRTAFQPKKWTLSVTMAAWQQLPKEAFAAVDYVNLMAYDHDGQHATYANAERDVQTMLKAGVPAGKLTLGVPFYGRHITQRERTLTYRDILAKHRPTPDTDEIDGVYFNGPTTLRKKVELVRSQKLAGVMVWELGQDAPGDASLLGVLSDALRKNSPIRPR